MTTERTYKALVVGCGTYPDDPELIDLYGPANDVDAMKEALRHPEWGLHAEVHIVLNESKATVEEAIERFFAGAVATDQLFLYFSGHGVREIHDRLFLAVANTNHALLRSTAVPFQLINDLSGETRAAATAVVLDCCFSGIMKGPGVSSYIDSRGRWTLASSRRDQLAADGQDIDAPSAFTELVAEALVANSDADTDHDGYVTMGDTHRYVGPRLEAQLGQTPEFKCEGTGDLVVALAPGYAVEFDQRRDWVQREDERIPVPAIPAVPSGALDLHGPDQDTPQGVDAGSQDLLALVEDGKEISARRLVRKRTKAAVLAVEADDAWRVLGPSLNVLSCDAAGLITSRSERWAEEAIAGLVAVYEAGFDSRGVAKPSLGDASGVSPPELWLGVIQRVMGVGGLAVREQQWGLVRSLAMQRPRGLDFRHYNNWIRHAVTMAARANLDRVEQDGQFVKRSFLASALEIVQAHECFRQDVYGSHKDAALDSMCQFDALACVAAMVEGGHVDGANFYPSFAAFDTERTEPIFVRLVSDSGIREAIAPITDRELELVLDRLSEVAQKEGTRFGGWWGFQDALLIEWLERAAVQAEV